VSAPLTIIGVILRMQSRTMSYVVVNIGCKAFHYLQVCMCFVRKFLISIYCSLVGDPVNFIHEFKNRNNMFKIIEKPKYCVQ
jgi:hypothetical protein